MHNRHLTQLFLRRFLENDLISPDADRLHVLSQACGVLISGGLFVTTVLSLGYLSTPFPGPQRTAVQVLRVEFLYSAWAMTVMALVAASAWDALSLDSRDTQILGALPLTRSVILRAKVTALIIFASGFGAALNVVPGLIHPIFAVARLGPTIFQVATLIVAQLMSTTAAAAFGFMSVLGLRETVHAILGPARFRRISLALQASVVVALVSTVLLIPGFSVRTANLWLARGDVSTSLLPPMWFVGLHDIISGHVWAELPRPGLPPRVAVAERAFDELYRNRRPLLHQLGLSGIGGLWLVMLVAAAAYFWNNRRLPDPPSPRTTERGRLGTSIEATAARLLARQPLVRAGFAFTSRVLASSAQNRLSIAIAFAVAIAVGIVSLGLTGVASSLDFSTPPISFVGLQLLLVAALAAGFRHSVRVPAELRARWLFHLVRPANHDAYLSGAKRGAIIRIAVPVLIALLPLHVMALGWQKAIVHSTYGLLVAFVLAHASLFRYRRLPFASSYLPAAHSTFAAVYALCFLIAVYSAAALERLALSTTRGTLVLFGVTAAIGAFIRVADLWQQRDRGDVELDELVDPPTLRLGLMD